MFLDLHIQKILMGSSYGIKEIPMIGNLRFLIYRLKQIYTFSCVFIERFPDAPNKFYICIRKSCQDIVR